MKFWSKGDNQSSLKYLEVNIQKIIIIFWVEEFQDMVHLIIVNWYNWSDIWIWNRFRVRLYWKIWRVNLNIAFINVMMIISPHDILNHRDGFGRRSPGFEVSFQRLSGPLYLWLSWFITMKGVERIQFFPRLCGSNLGPKIMQALPCVKSFQRICKYYSI